MSAEPDVSGFCESCPDHEGCAGGIPCDIVKLAHYGYGCSADCADGKHFHTPEDYGCDVGLGTVAGWFL